MQATYVQRIRLTFTKTGPTRFIGHLDLARALERALNRAKIPMAYSQGFNRRIKMQLAAALPLGFTSDCELADIWLIEQTSPEEVRERLMRKMAPGIEVIHVEEVPLRDPPLQTITSEASYAVTFLDPVNESELQQRIEDLMASESCMRERARRGKPRPYDLRPLIIELGVNRRPQGALQLHIRLALQQGKSGRPDEVLLALGLDPLAARINRTRILLSHFETKGGPQDRD
ncbi:MAG: TIGR03936 family radical SAM-associated protein [Anaerolineae bacterium]